MANQMYILPTVLFFALSVALALMTLGTEVLGGDVPSDATEGEAPFDATDFSKGPVLDALTEGVYTLLAFVAAAVFIQWSKWHRSRRSAVWKADRTVEKLGACSVAPLRRPHRPASELCNDKPHGGAPKEATSARASPPRRNAELQLLSQGRVEVALLNLSRVEGDALAASVRAGRASELPSLLGAARSRAATFGASDTALEEFTAMALLASLRACASRRCFFEALVAYDHVAKQIGSGCFSTWSLLLYSAVEAWEFHRCTRVWQRLLASGTPSTNDFVNMVRFYANEHDAVGLRQMLTNLVAQDIEIDVVGRNRALSVCTQRNGLKFADVLADDTLFGYGMDAIGYNTLMKAYAQAWQVDQCLRLYGVMRQGGIPPSQVTFGILLDACIDAKQYERAREVFEDLRGSGLAMNVVHYTTFLKGLASAGEFETASAVLQEMAQSPDAQPDLVTYSTLVKAYAEHGKVMEAVGVIKVMLSHGIVPDGIIFNIVLSGCSVASMNSEEIIHVFRWLSRHGLQPNTTTISILIKAMTSNQAFDTALEMLEDAPTTLEVQPEARLFAQLAQACAKAGKGAKVDETYAALSRAAARKVVYVDEATNCRLYRLCSQSGSPAKASQFYWAIAREAGATSEGSSTSSS